MMIAFLLGSWRLMEQGHKRVLIQALIRYKDHTR